VALGNLDEARDAGDVDYAAGVAVMEFCCLLQKREESGG